MLKRFGMIASALALLALAGCSNGMLGKDDATVNGLRDAGGRTAMVTITNFAGDGASRSVVGGPLRTIAPDAPNVKDQGKWYFIATGSANGLTLDPRFVTVDPTSGRVDLTDLDSQIWNVTITMFDKTKLDAAMPGLAADLSPANAQTVMTTRMAHAVLSGSGTVDLVRGNSDVVITLTARGIDGSASLDLTITLHQDDIAEVTGETYDVSYGLYDKITGAEILVGTQKNQNSVDQQAAAAAAAGYKYTANGNVVPKGEYMFKVIINPDKKNGLGPWVWSDIIHFENAQDIVDTMTLPAIIGKPPAAPSNFVVYWDVGDVNAATGEYKAHFAWDRDSYNEWHFKLQIADVTGKLDKTFGNYTGNGTGPTVINGSQQLWENAIVQDTDFADDTKYTLGENFQSPTYPIYAKEGSLLAGSTSVDYILETGRVYAVRIASTNASGDSTWVYAGATEPTNATHTVWKQTNNNAELFEEDALSLFTITYDLTGYKLVQQGATLNTNIGTSVAVEAFDPVAGTSIVNLPYGQNNQTGYLLYTDALIGQGGNAAHDDGKNTPWDSWVARITGDTFNFGAAAYDDYKNLVLKPNAISGGSASLEVDSSGTYKDSLTPDNLFVHLQADETPYRWTNNDTLPKQTTDLSAGNLTMGIGKNANGKYIINLDEAANDYLQIEIGVDVVNLGKVTVQGKASNWADVVRATYSIVDAAGYAWRTVEGTTYASIRMDGLGGDYRLYVEAKSASGINFTYQTDIVVKNKTETYTP